MNTDLVTLRTNVQTFDSLINSLLVTRSTYTSALPHGDISVTQSIRSQTIFVVQAASDTLNISNRSYE